jgi:four helix bundle protein
VSTDLADVLVVRIQSYRDLDAWKVSMEFVEQVYGLTTDFPRTEAYGLTMQLRRAAVGIPSNISEGHRRGTGAYRHYISIALGSQAECETQLELALRLRMGSRERIVAAMDTAGRVGQLLYGLLRSLPSD